VKGLCQKTQVDLDMLWEAGVSVMARCSIHTTHCDGLPLRSNVLHTVEGAAGASPKVGVVDMVRCVWWMRWLSVLSDAD
jgi:hypothetical protein